MCAGAGWWTGCWAESEELSSMAEVRAGLRTKARYAGGGQGERGGA
jgi:hypothetical protein